MQRILHSFFVVATLVFVVAGCNKQQKGRVHSGVNGKTAINAAIERNVALVKNDSRVLQAFEYIESIEDETLEEHIYITEIPAPPFKEQQRAIAYQKMLQRAGADSIWIDGVGNVLALKRGTVGSRTVALAAHLDTVFPEGTPINVRVSGDTLYAPGIGDDSRGLVEVLTILKAINHSEIRTKANLL